MLARLRTGLDQSNHGWRAELRHFLLAIFVTRSFCQHCETDTVKENADRFILLKRRKTANIYVATCSLACTCLILFKRRKTANIYVYMGHVTWPGVYSRGGKYLGTRLQNTYFMAEALEEVVLAFPRKPGNFGK